MEDKVIFSAWLKAMEWDGHGGQTAAAKALGKDSRHIRRYMEGASLAHDTRLAMTAIAQGLKPWDPETEGTPNVWVKLSVDKV